MRIDIMCCAYNRGIKRCAHVLASALLLVFMVLAFTAQTFTVQAAEPPATTNPQITRLQVQIDALTKRLDKLEKTVQLNQRPAEQHPLNQHPVDTTGQLTHARPGLAALHEMEKMKAGWKKLQRGLSETQLVQLLGNPDLKTRVNHQVLWYYIYPSIGRGSVMFDYNSKVSAWQKPPF